MENWEIYYIDEIKDKDPIEGDTFTPSNMDFEAPILDRYEQIKKYRILLYPAKSRLNITKMFFDLEKVCKNFGFPLFFVIDFEQYQTKNKWTYQGQKIQNVKGAFFGFANAKKQSMRNKGKWLGPNIENYMYCGSWENRTEKTA